MLTPISLDIETINATGSADFRWHKPGFTILSLALSWREGFGLQSWFSCDPAEIETAVVRLHKSQRRLIVHNLAFEKGVFDTIYPQYPLNWFADTMRMAQLKDNGGDWRDLVFNNDVLDPEASPDLGCSLEAAASRVLGKDLHHHKAERDAFLKENHGIRSKQGAYIHLLPPHILKSYNIADTVVTLELYEALWGDLSGIWEKDWDLYYNRTDLMNKAYRRGILIDLPQLYTVITSLETEIALIEKNYIDFMCESIKKWAELYKTDANEFNIGSNKQLKELYVGVLGMKAKHLTDKGQKSIKNKEMTLDEALNEYPSFQSKHLSDWGESGELLKARRKRLLVLSQAMSTFTLASQNQGRVHPEIRVAGTRTNRVSGGRDE